MGVTAFLFTTPAIAQPSTTINPEYLMTVYLRKEPTIGVDPGLVISRDSAGGWVKGKVSGAIINPSADWVRAVPSDHLQLRLDGRVTIETDEHEIVYMSYGGRMNCDKETTDRFRKGDTLRAGDCYLVSAPTFQTKSEKYSWLNDVQVVGKMVEYKPGQGTLSTIFSS